MINISEVLETNKMIEQENLDVRTITLGISLLDCIASDLETLKKISTIRLRQLQRIWCPPVRLSKPSTGFRL